MSNPSDETTTWLGPIPNLSEIDTISDNMAIECPPCFAPHFNSNPVGAVEGMANTETRLLDQYSLGTFLFYCPNLYPSALSRLFFASTLENARSLLFYFFSSANLEFMEIMDAAKLLLSRIAFPIEQERIEAIFDAFADAYLAANVYLDMTPKTVSHIAVSCVVFSIFKTKSQSMELDSFMKLLKKVPVSEAYKKNVYNAVSANPIPIFVTFASSVQEPDYTKTGFLKKLGGSFKGKTKRFFAIEEFSLRYYKDSNRKHLIGEVELEGIVAELVRATGKKETDRMMIRRLDGGQIGLKILKDGTRKKSNHKKYEAFAEDNDTLMSWISACNFVSFWSILQKITESDTV